MTILLVEDDVLNREGFRMFLEQVGYQVEEAGDTATAWQMMTQTEFQAVILDIVLPEQPGRKFDLRESAGIVLAERVKMKYPALGIVIFSAHEDRGSAILEMVCQGVRGLAYQLKGQNPMKMLDALKAVQAGHVLIDAEVTSHRLLSERLEHQLTPLEREWIDQIVPKLDLLSKREIEVAYRLAAAHSNFGIAEALQISEKTVESYITNIYRKTELNQLDRRLRPPVLLAKAWLAKELG